MASAGKKRKLGEDVQKWYAVRAGKTPGVYKTWAECQKMTTGFKGASYKSFTSEQEAKDFVAGRVVASKSAPGKPIPYYGVAVGHKTGVFRSWDEAKALVADIKGPKYKKFETREEAEEFVRTHGSSAVLEKKEKHTEDAEEPAAKKVKKTAAAPKKGTKGFLQVYTDGSSRGNGRVGAIAGVGVWFGDDDPRNISEPLVGNPQTNQRAELTGILRALEIAPKDRDMEIITDSNYSINCCTVWVSSWIKNQWRTSQGKEVMNKDLIEMIKELLDEREGRGVATRFTWIKGHDDDYGNTEADKLAVGGAEKGRVQRTRN